MQQTLTHTSDITEIIRIFRS